MTEITVCLSVQRRRKRISDSRKRGERKKEPEKWNKKDSKKKKQTRRNYCIYVSPKQKLNLRREIKNTADSSLER